MCFLINVLPLGYYRLVGNVLKIVNNLINLHVPKPYPIKKRTRIPIDDKLPGERQFGIDEKLYILIRTFHR